jgi:hypothetical protein
MAEANVAQPEVPPAEKLPDAPEVLACNAYPGDSLANKPVTEQPLEETPSGSYPGRRRRRKLTRFILLEFTAVAVLVPSAWVVLSHDLTNPILIKLMNIVTISAAAALAIIPIVMFAMAPTFLRDRRM